MGDLVRAAGDWAGQGSSRGAGWILVALLPLVLLQTALLVHFARGAGRERRRLREMLVGASGLDLEALLRQHTRERVGIAADLAGAEARIERLEAALAESKRHAGLVRFDAFADIGGEGSFALALVDDGGDGVVLSSLLGREGGRVYGKTLVGGRADRELTEEEREAIRRAAARRPETTLAAGNRPR